MIEVFQTSVEDQDQAQADSLKALLLGHFPGSRVDFDLEDCDRVLRVEAPELDIRILLHLMDRQGICCKVLD